MEQNNLFGRNSYATRVAAASLGPVPRPRDYRETAARPRSHREDPEASRDAAERMQRTGAAAAHKRLTLELLAQHPGSTARQLAAAAGDAFLTTGGRVMRDYELLCAIRKRLSDCKRAGHARHGETVDGETTWWLG